MSNEKFMAAMSVHNKSIYVLTSKLISCRNCCVDLLCTFAFVSMFCAVCSSDFAFSIILSWSSRGGQDIKVFVAGGFGNSNQQDLFLWQ